MWIFGGSTSQAKEPVAGEGGRGEQAYETQQGG